MRALDHLLNDYDRIHKHPVNRALHVAGVPLVMVGLTGLLSLLPAARMFGHVLDPMWVGLAAGTTILGRYSWRFALGILAVLVAAYGAAAAAVTALGLYAPVIWVAAALLGAALHMIGHRVFERAAAQFDQHPEFLLAGPLALALLVCRKLKIPI